ncbi:hypothetical protein FHG87_001621 [Trinorchestia longiramus]|nr:hypothetical protein FHG87_001621 [Trinorchestia longiramus]
MGVLYKLSRCGVRGTMLRWLQAYLKDRPFKVFMEGTYSSERIAKTLLKIPIALVVLKKVSTIFFSLALTTLQNVPP